MAYSPNILISEPTPGDPSVTNTWGTILNTNFSLIDSAIAGILSLSVAGSSNVILTSNSGAPDQSRNQRFNFSGVLTGNITVFWPQSLNRFFSAANNTTGAYTLTIAVNNGAGVAAGTTVAITQGAQQQLFSDGTNITSQEQTPGVTSVNASGGTTGFSFTGGPITGAGTLTMAGILIGANGGTGVANTGRTITIGGNVVTGAALTTVGAFTTTQAFSGAVGYLNVPVNSQSAAYLTVLADEGKMILHPTADNNARTFTIDGSVAYLVGDAITFVNQINTVTIAISTDTLILAGQGTTGSRTLAANGLATAVKIASGVWFITGSGLT